ncbi:MAG: hypothetical protein IH984_17460 [Planctomycetes bacterium]|nr:hypothetical protein [Planctomycetota bacterium]
MKLIWLVGCIAIIACASWAILLQDIISVDLITIDLRQAAPLVENDSDQSLDLSAFTANLWNPPPVKKTSTALAKKEPPRAKPLKLQLIGIISDGNTLKAALYDPDSDQLLIVANGQSILGHTIRDITKDTVLLSDGRFTHYLQLEADKGDGS